MPGRGDRKVRGDPVSGNPSGWTEWIAERQEWREQFGEVFNCRRAVRAKALEVGLG